MNSDLDFLNFLQGKSAKEPNGAEFISALAAGNNAQFIVAACASFVDYTTLALVAAAQQTGGRVVCILPGIQELHLSEKILGHTNTNDVEFIVGNAGEMLLNCYKEADFLAVDCNLENHETILKAVQESSRLNNTIVLGYNAFCKGSWRNSGLNTQLLPIGEGLLLRRVAAAAAAAESKISSRAAARRGHWIVKVDKCTGEEHVFRVRSPQGRVVKA